MNNGFARGLLVGSLIGASLGKMMSSDVMNNKNKRRMMRTGRTLMRRSGNILGDVVDLFR